NGYAAANAGLFPGKRHPPAVVSAQRNGRLVFTLSMPDGETDNGVPSLEAHTRMHFTCTLADIISVSGRKLHRTQDIPRGKAEVDLPKAIINIRTPGIRVKNPRPSGVGLGWICLTFDGIRVGKEGRLLGNERGGEWVETIVRSVDQHTALRIKRH